MSMARAPGGHLTLLSPQVGVIERLHVNHRASSLFHAVRRRPYVSRLALVPILAGNLRHVRHGPIAKVAGQGRDLLRIPSLDEVRRLVGPLGPFARHIAPVLSGPAGLGGGSRARYAGCCYICARGQGGTDLTGRADGRGRLLLVLDALLAEGDAL